MTITLDNIKEISERLRDKLSKYEDFKGLYVYGSRIYGNPRPGSDLDIVAVFEKRLPYEKRLEISGEVMEVRFDYDFDISVFKMTEEELKINPTFFEEIQRGLYYAAG